MLNSRFSFARWLILGGVALTLVGYFAPWIDHASAGLAILGIDLGEYVKFLAPVLTGEMQIWREGFYLPLLAVSLALSLYAFRDEMRHALWLRVAMLLVAGVAALNMLPPAWSPGLLRTAEFRMQTLWIVLALGALATSPLLALLPRWLPPLVVMPLALGGLWFSISQFIALLPAIETLYNHALTPAWGMWVMGAGLVALASGSLLAIPVMRIAQDRAQVPVM